ncbi:MAG: hypothetical protein IPJ54_18390 [Saprospiraceae bacterium]|nr:hypothetical protein [Saprospiraceae bacterium]
MSKSSNHYIVPDFIIHNRDGELELTLNNKNSPICALNGRYCRKCADQGQPEG